MNNTQNKRVSLSQLETFERFYRSPKIFTNKESYYFSMSVEAKYTYGILKDRFELSKKNNWVDKNNNVFILFSVAELMAILGYSNKKTINIKKELIEYGLLEEDRQGLNRPNHLYILNVDTERKCKIDTSKSEEHTLLEVYDLHTNDTEKNDTEIDDDEKIIKSISSENPFLEISQKVKNELNIDLDFLDQSKIELTSEGVQNISQELENSYFEFGISQTRFIFDEALNYTLGHLADFSKFASYLVNGLQMREKKIRLAIKRENISKVHQKHFTIPMNGAWNENKESRNL